MAQLWMVKVDAFDVMVSPVEYFGPIQSINRVQFRGFNNNDSIGPDVPEMQWPTFCKYRNLGWNIVGTRPFRPMPRALRFFVSSFAKTLGTIPAGIIDHEFLIVDPTNGEPDPKSAVYTGSDIGSVYECRMFIRAVNDAHRTINEPLEFTDDDFQLFTLLTYVGPTDRWSLFRAPDDWNLSDVLPITETPTLALTKVEPHPDGDSRQIIWLANPEPPVVCTQNAQLPYTDWWPFAVPSQFIEVSPLPATEFKIRIIDPIIGPVTGFSRINYTWTSILVAGSIEVTVSWDGVIARHSVEVRIDEPGGAHIIDGGLRTAPFDIRFECRQLGPLMRIDVFSPAYVDTVVFPATYNQCNNRFLNFVSFYNVPHMQQLQLQTVQ